MLTVLTGLSPLARGNHTRKSELLDTSRPIPARAGESKTTSMILVFNRAYPRSRGGILQRQYQQRLEQGLSPLARGNPDDPIKRFPESGPIPARAGESIPSETPNCSTRAYPRSRGGIFFNRRWNNIIYGLSPLARGNRPHHLFVQAAHGPIPARAGESLF